MIQQKASDLFLTADVEPSMKINGQIVPIAKTKLSGEVVGQLLHSITSEKQRKEFETELECNFAISVPNVSRFRVNVFQQQLHPDEWPHKQARTWPSSASQQPGPEPRTKGKTRFA